jgi:hypothetical protein
LAEHITIHQPVTAPEKELVDQMAIARWRIRRFVGAETDLLDSEMARNRDKINKEFAPTDSGLHLALAIKSLADESRCLSLMSRYESRLQRVHDKAYTALRELQQSRAYSPSVSAGETQPVSEPEPPAALDSHPAPSPTPPPATPATAPSVSAGEIPTHNPSVSAGEIPIENQKSPNEPTTPTDSSPDIHLCTPIPAGETGNSEDHDE